MTYARRNSADIQFGQTLRSVREHRGLGSGELARQIGAHPVSVSRWENGVSKCSPKHRDLLSKALLVPLQHAHIPPHDSPALANALRWRQQLVDEITALERQLEDADRAFKLAQAEVAQHA